MKNLLIYINPSKTFFGQGHKNFRDCSTLVKIQIDNSLSLGWKVEDIMLVTNFAYQYHGVKAILVDDTNYCSFRPLSTKTLTVAYLLENNLLDKDQIYWVHDFDAYQNSAIKETDLQLGGCDIGFTDYGWSPKWSLGSYFFKTSAADIFGRIKDTIYQLQTEDERAFGHLTGHSPGRMQKRIKRLNISYNFGMREVGYNFKIAQKPIKVVHFHPNYKDSTMKDTTLNCFMYGKNEIDKPIMSKRLIKIFHHHGVK